MTHDNRLVRSREIAQEFHEAQRRLARWHSDELATRPITPWSELPPDKQSLMAHAAFDLLRRGVIL